MRALVSTSLVCMRACAWARRGAVVLAGLSCLSLSWAAGAGGMTPLSDEELSSVQARDGFAFNLQGYSLSGSLSLTYSMPSPSTASLTLGNLAFARSDDPAGSFADPYYLDIISRGNGLADVIQISEPLNTSGALKWQFAADLSVNANGSNINGGALVVKDLASYGGVLSLTTPDLSTDYDGIAFGLSLRTDIGAVLLRPRGRDDITQINPSSVGEQLAFTGIHIGAADSSGNSLGKPWVIVDITNQPGIVNAGTYANGQSYLHIGIDWSKSPSGAPIGGLLIDNIAFKSDVTGTVDLGSSRIGTIQVQYLDVRFRAGL